jgi:hypothetical protein
LELCRALGDNRGVALILHRLALLEFDNGDLDATRAMIDESQRLAGGSPLIDAVNLWMYALLAEANGHIEKAMELSERSAEQAQTLEWTWWVSGQRSYLSKLALGIGDLVRSEREGRAALVIARDHENPYRAAAAVATLARVALASEDSTKAGLLWGSSESTMSVSRFDLGEYGGELLAQTEPAFTSARQTGRDLDIWDAVAIALGELEPPQTVP